MASGVPDYSQFTDSIEIPFTNSDNESSTPAIDVWVNGSLIENAGLDTGSTGFSIGASLVPGFENVDKSTLKQDKIIFVTSGITWSGYWCPITVDFKDSQGNTATADGVKALVITDPAVNDDIHYIGIASQTKNTDEGEFTPDKNVLLAITQFGNAPVNNSTFRHGFIMRNRSISIGLTEQNTGSFQYTQLSPDPKTHLKWYYQDVNSALRLNNEPWMHGPALIDSGVHNMQIFSTQMSGKSEELPTGTVVTVKFPDENSTLPEYSFTWPGPNSGSGAEPWVPFDVTVFESIHKDKMFVNTGRCFRAKFDTLFDADGGYWGIRASTG